MSAMDFPTWFGLGSYGGLACSLAAAASVAGYALRRRRGTPRQLANTILICLVASCLMFVPIWWNQTRLDIYGPTVGVAEVVALLTWTALVGWCLPLGTLTGYVLLATPQRVGLGLDREHADPALFASLNDPGRNVEPLGSDQPWGRLVSLDDDAETGAPNALLLTRQLTLVGRELDNDIVIDDERGSRHHAEIRWDHGHVQLLDRNSMNGTLVNRQLARGLVPLKSGDVVELGDQRYRFELLVSGNLPYVATTLADQVTHKMRSAVDTPPASPRLALVALDGTVSGARWDLREAMVSIGRDHERQICLPHESVSRLHAQIVRQRAGYFVTDLDSSNGTLLNGQPVTAPAMLMPGDILAIGEIKLRCESEQVEPVTPQAGTPVPASPAVTPPPAAAAGSSNEVVTMQRIGPTHRPDRPRLGPPKLTPSQPLVDESKSVH